MKADFKKLVTYVEALSDGAKSCLGAFGGRQSGIPGNLLFI
jgi:hypothetical protein